jgi:hypothetical protein
MRTINLRVPGQGKTLEELQGFFQASSSRADRGAPISLAVSEVFGLKLTVHLRRCGSTAWVLGALSGASPCPNGGAPLGAAQGCDRSGGTEARPRRQLRKLDALVQILI